MNRTLTLFITVGMVAMLFMGCGNKSPDVNVFKGQNIIYQVSGSSTPEKAIAFADMVNNTVNENTVIESDPDYIIEFLPIDSKGNSERFVLWIIDNKIYVAQEKNPKKIECSRTSVQQFNDLLKN